MELIYLDHNGSSPIADEVFEAMLPWLRGIPGNPASNHAYGRAAKSAIETARNQVAGLIGCQADEIIFTSGGTESNNLALKGAAEVLGKGHIITSAIEHPSVLLPLRYLASRGFELDIAGVDREGLVQVGDVERLVRADTALASFMLANNETGAIQPVREIAEILRPKSVLLHCDAGQIVGKEPVNVEELGVDLLSIAGHKLNAPKGVGALYVRRGVRIAPQNLGAGHERGLRSGTQDVLEIVGLGVAAERYMRSAQAITEEYRSLRSFFEEQLVQAIPEVLLNGPADTRLVNTSNFAFPKVKSGELLRECPQVACAPGAACHRDHSTPSHVLLAMGCANEHIEGSVRFSLGHRTTREELSKAVQLLAGAYRRLRNNESAEMEANNCDTFPIPAPTAGMQHEL